MSAGNRPVCGCAQQEENERFFCGHREHLAGYDPTHSMCGQSERLAIERAKEIESLQTHLDDTYRMLGKLIITLCADYAHGGDGEPPWLAALDARVQKYHATRPPVEPGADLTRLLQAGVDARKKLFPGG